MRIGVKLKHPPGVKAHVVEAMRWGAVNAASVVSEVGAEKGLLKKEELEKRLSEHLDFIAVTL